MDCLHDCISRFPPDLKDHLRWWWEECFPLPRHLISRTEQKPHSFHMHGRVYFRAWEKAVISACYAKNMKIKLISIGSFKWKLLPRGKPRKQTDWKRAQGSGQEGQWSVDPGWEVEPGTSVEADWSLFDPGHMCGDAFPSSFHWLPKSLSNATSHGPFSSLNPTCLGPTRFLHAHGSPGSWTWPCRGIPCELPLWQKQIWGYTPRHFHEVR